MLLLFDLGFDFDFDLDFDFIWVSRRSRGFSQILIERG